MKVRVSMVIILMLLSPMFMAVVAERENTSAKSITYVTGRIKDLQIDDELIQFTSIKLYSKVLFQYDGHRWYFGGSYGWFEGITHEYPRDEYRFYGILNEPFIWGLFIFKAT